MYHQAAVKKVERRERTGAEGGERGGACLYVCDATLPHYSVRWHHLER